MEKGCVEKSGVAVADVADKACEDFPVRRGRKPGGEGVEVFLCLTQIGIGDAARLVVKALSADGINDVPDVFVGKGLFRETGEEGVTLGRSQ